MGSCNNGKEILQLVYGKLKGRLIETCISLNTGNKNKTKIKIINTYAPRMGYNIEERNSYLGETSNIIKNTNEKYCIIWRTDNNGQISYNGNSRNIGKWTYSNKYEKTMAKTI